MTALESARLLAENYIDHQRRTSAEVRRRLTKSGFEEDVVEAVVADLERAGLLDDSKFSADWVESRSRRKGFGKLRLASELRQKGVDKSNVDEAVAEIDPDMELQAAISLARKRVSPTDSGDPAVKRRLAGYLQRRGYNWEIIQQVFTEVFANEE
jgi:regulatory protein